MSDEDKHEPEVDVSISDSQYTILDVYHGRQLGLENVRISMALDLEIHQMYDALSRYYKHNDKVYYHHNRGSLKSVEEGIWEELVNKPTEVYEPFEDIDDMFPCDDLRIERMGETSIWVRGYRDEEEFLRLYCGFT